jgi:hypothetical protein
MADTLSTAELSDFIPEVWANEALGMLPSFLNLGKTVYRNFKNEAEKKGNKIHIPKRGALVANAKVPGVAVQLQNPDSDEVEVTLDEHWEVTFLVEDVAAAQTVEGVMEGYIRDAVIVLAEKIEDKLAALYALAGTPINAGSALEDAELLTIRKTFVDNKVPKIAPKYLYLSSDQVNDIMGISKFIEADKYGSSRPIMDGELGSIYGMKVFESQSVAQSGSPAVDHGLGYSDDAMVLALRPLIQAPAGAGVIQSVIYDEQNGLGIRVSASWNADHLGMQVTLDTLFGVAVMRAEHLIDIQTT